LVLLVGGDTAEADERESARRGELPAVGVADPALEEPGEPQVLADQRLKPLAAQATEHGPQLQRAEASAERGPVVGEALRLVRGAQVLRDEAERPPQRLRPAAPEGRAVHRHEEPLVRVDDERIGPLYAR